ncbi:aldo/keto reductase [Cohnella hongkongensis]|uniref:Aldo/keto reductase n=1 Tax=Cohnella hongkongensis TaxID=178337 RepID=A0ABV9FER9_9BACL
MRKSERFRLAPSRMTLGTVQLGMPYGVANPTGQPSAEESCLMIGEALRLGINCLDTASGYGESERVIGQCLQGKRDRPAIVTKFALPREIEKGEVERAIVRSVEASLERLRVPVLDMAMLHHAGDLLRQGSEIIRACRNLIRAGCIQAAGVSFGAEPARQFEQIWEYASDPVFEGVQVPVNVLDQRLVHSEALRRLQDADKIVFARSVFLQGLLLMNPDRVPAHLTEAGDALQHLQRLSEREGMSVAQLAVSYVRDLPGVHSLVIGAESVDQIRRNSELIEGPPLQERIRSELQKRFEAMPDRLISPQLWQ